MQTWQLEKAKKEAGKTTAYSSFCTEAMVRRLCLQNYLDYHYEWESGLSSRKIQLWWSLLGQVQNVSFSFAGMCIVAALILTSLSMKPAVVHSKCITSTLIQWTFKRQTGCRAAYLTHTGTCLYQLNSCRSTLSSIFHFCLFVV